MGGGRWAVGGGRPLMESSRLDNTTVIQGWRRGEDHRSANWQASMQTVGLSRWLNGCPAETTTEKHAGPPFPPDLRQIATDTAPPKTTLIDPALPRRKDSFSHPRHDYPPCSVETKRMLSPACNSYASSPSSSQSASLMRTRIPGRLRLHIHR